MNFQTQVCDNDNGVAEFSSCKKGYCDLTINGIRHKLSVTYRPSESRSNLIVFVHGLGCSKESFGAVWKCDQLSEFSLLTLDLPGFGLSEKPSEYSYSMEDQAQVCTAVLSHFGYKQVHIVGHSMGGAIALLLLQHLKAASFVNVEGNLTDEDCGLVSRSTQAMSEAEFLNSGFSRVKQLLSDYPAGCFDLKNVSPTAFYRSSKSLVQWSDSGRLLKQFLQLSLPSVFIYGEKNANLKVLPSLSGTVNVTQIPNAAHFPMIDNAPEFYSAVAEFINEVVPMNC